GVLKFSHWLIHREQSYPMTPLLGPVAPEGFASGGGAGEVESRPAHTAIQGAHARIAQAHLHASGMRSLRKIVVASAVRGVGDGLDLELTVRADAASTGTPSTGAPIRGVMLEVGSVVADPGVCPQVGKIQPAGILTGPVNFPKEDGVGGAVLES